MSAMGGFFPGRRVLDLFSGSGALGLECLSRGAEHCTFVERSRASLRVLGANIELLGAAPRSTVIRGDALAYAAQASPEDHDLALADPPYGQGLARALVERFVARPFARELWVEHRSDDDLPEVQGMEQRRYGDTTLSSLTAALNPPPVPPRP
jgi:16S rRNA (guanine966-N2)-methyltransferase